MFRTTHQGLAFAGVLIAASSTADAQDIPNGFQNSSAQSNAEVFVYTSNNPDAKLRPAATHVCFLTMAAGSLRNKSAIGVHRSSVDSQTMIRLGALSGAPAFNATLDDSDENWKLGGGTHGSDMVAAEAVCVPMSSFVMDPGGVTRVSGVGYAFTSTASACSGSARTDMWGAFASTYLAFVRGGFYGFGDVVYAEEGSLSTSSTLNAAFDKCGDEGFGANAYSFLANVSIDNSIPENYPNYSVRNEHFRSNENESQSLVLAPTKTQFATSRASRGTFATCASACKFPCSGSATRNGG